MTRLINLNRISSTKIEENKDGYSVLKATFPYPFEEMIFQHNFYENIHGLFYKIRDTYVVLNLEFCICNNVSTKCTSSLHNKEYCPEIMYVPYVNDQ